MKKQTWQQQGSPPGVPIHAPHGCVDFFLMPANGRPCRSTGRGGTGIVSGAPGATPWGTVTSSGRPSVSVTRKIEHQIMKPINCDTTYTAVAQVPPGKSGEVTNPGLVPIEATMYNALGEAIGVTKAQMGLLPMINKYLEQQSKQQGGGYR